MHGQFDAVFFLGDQDAKRVKACQQSSKRLEALTPAEHEKLSLYKKAFYDQNSGKKAEQRFLGIVQIETTALENAELHAASIGVGADAFNPKLSPLAKFPGQLKILRAAMKPASELERLAHHMFYNPVQVWPHFLFP